VICIPASPELLSLLRVQFEQFRKNGEAWSSRREARKELLDSPTKITVNLFKSNGLALSPPSRVLRTQLSQLDMRTCWKRGEFRTKCQI